ncbi:adenosine deaminase [Alloacidobacterium sp.]|uniref:adenosine deaminase n=1 Tax=Alloacidobacterium sp. TaxID=2951999 RepID=UPI002D71FF20|nr:adenosine deaminase [Alloacidobacterium sp.]HYK38255.1 adenosine deaminase [Alloacidobacterium sp.]
MTSELQGFVRRLPKAELHLHLEGTISPETLVELSRRHNAEPLNLPQAQALYEYRDFHGFLMAFKTVTERLRTADDYELITYRMLETLAAQGVVHAEAYVAVGIVFFWDRSEFEPIFAAMEQARERAEKNFGITLYWIFDAVRHFGVEAAARVFRKAAEMKRDHPSIAGIGIGGDERKGPAELFRDAYKEARDAGLRLTVHAGEAVGPESIWAALNIGAERLGHALTAIHDQELVHLLAERQIPLEICVTSNVKTGCCPRLEEHPLRQYFDDGLMVTLNSDDPTMFGSDLVGEYMLGHTEFGFTEEHLRELASNSIEASFLPPEQKVRWLRHIEQCV